MTVNIPTADRARGSRRRQPWRGVVGPARTVALGTVVIIALFGAALVVSGWRYSRALDRFSGTDGIVEQDEQLSAMLDAEHVLPSHFTAPARSSVDPLARRPTRSV